MRIFNFQEKDIFKGNLILVNGQNPLGDKVEEEVRQIPINLQYPDISMEKNAAVMLSRLISDIGGEDKIIPVSGFRKRKEQEQIYSDSLREHGEEFTKKYVAYPGHSEHQTGYAIDLARAEKPVDFIRPDFPDVGVFKEFREKAPQYGYILRYQKEKEPVTGIAYEPWHFRYIGYPHSKILYDHRASLEEYIMELKNYTYQGKHLEFGEKEQDIEIFYINREEFKFKEIKIPSHRLYQVSGNNIDGVIITLWRKEG